jgi:hypothetical protein
MNAADIEGAELRTRELAQRLRTEDATRRYLIRFAEELDGYSDPFDLAGPLIARLFLFEPLFSRFFCSVS